MTMDQLVRIVQLQDRLATTVFRVFRVCTVFKGRKVRKALPVIRECKEIQVIKGTLVPPGILVIQGQQDTQDRPE